jgi:hypothetical protein
MIKTRHKIGVIEVAIVLAIVSIPIAVAISYWNNARFVKEDSRMARAASFMLLTYASGNNCMPPTRVRGAGGEVLSSWRFAAADSMIYEVEDEKKFGYPSVDKAWNAQGNAELRNSSGFPFYIDPTRPGHKARFVAITGPGTAFDEAAPCRLPGYQKNMTLPSDTCQHRSVR